MHEDVVMMARRQGYILVLALAVVGIMSMLLMKSVMRLTVFTRLGAVVTNREQACMLAWSGVACTMAQLSVREEASKKAKSANFSKEAQGNAPAPESPEAALEKRLALQVKRPLVTINRWHTKKFTQDVDGIDGSCRWYVTGDNGKINLNALADEELFKNEAIAAALRELSTRAMAVMVPQSAQAKVDLVAILKRLRKKRTCLFLDATDIYEDNELQRLRIARIADPDMPSQVSLNDMFSVDRESVELSMWQLSPSVEKALGLERKKALSDADWKRIVKLLSGGDEQDPLATIMNVLYNGDVNKLPQRLLPVLSAKFEANLFSVVSYGSYGGVVVKLVATLQRRRMQDGEQEEYRFFVKKFSWLV